MLHVSSKIQIYLFVLLLLSSASASRAAGRSSARVKFVIGKVQIMAGGKTSWKLAKWHQAVYSGDRIRTSLNARIELSMPDGSIIKVNQNSIFDVKEIKTVKKDNEDKMSFSLWAGNIWAKFKKIVNTRQIRTIESPSAVVAIRGTILAVDVDADKTTHVRVFEGRVAVKSRGATGEVMVGSNQESVIPKGRPPSAPQTFSNGTGNETPSPASKEGLSLKVNSGKLQYTDAAVIMTGVPLSGRVSAGASVKANGIPLTVQANGQFSGRIPVREGLNEIRIVARKAGAEASKKLRIYVNTKAPEIQLSRPLVAGYTNRRDYSLSGAVFDPTPRDKVKVYLNNELIDQIQGRGTFNRTIILKEGKNKIQLAAVDFSGNRTEKAEQIFLDTVKPIVTVTEPARQVAVLYKPPKPPTGNYSFAKERFRQTIRGVIIDPAPSSGIKRVSVNGKEIKPHTDGSFETEILLTRGLKGQPGENRITFYVEDMAGNITRDNSHVIYIR